MKYATVKYAKHFRSFIWCLFIVGICKNSYDLITNLIVQDYRTAFMNAVSVFLYMGWFYLDLKP